MLENYFDEKGQLKKEIFIDDAKRMAETFVRDEPSLKYTALRNFYNKIREIEFKLKRTKNFEDIRQDIYSLVPLVNYQFNRRIVPSSYKEFIEKQVNLAVKDERSFYAFLEYHKSILAYSVEHSQEREERRSK